jgi:uncharacterized Zn finger protein (UPF0148 family)
MVSKWDMKQYIKKNADRIPYIYKEDEDAIYDKNGNYLASLDEFLDIYRKKSGESFESIYYEHGLLENILRCTECGTVIFTTEDEDYDPRLKCPTCTDYHTYFEYWTKEDIESDEEKQNTIKFFKEMTEKRIEREKRIKKRNGKYDWEIAVKKFYGKKRFLKLALECDDITESYFKGLRLKIELGKKEFADDVGYSKFKFITIPLSWSQFYIQFIYPHLGKCHPDFRSKWYIGKPMENKKMEK